ncbi:MAG: hypothetical protein JKY90_06615, partial [Gammaproteobacteria bacterium]|nr:hypothetical protein [Gammaproteobacteria bacterium]
NVWMREAGFRIDKLVVTSNVGFVPTGTGPTESARDTATGGGGTTVLLEDNFNDGNFNGWTIVNNCQRASPSWTVIGGELIQVGDCRGFSPEGVAIGSYALSDVSLPSDIEIQLSVRSSDPANDGTSSNDSSIWKFDTIGVIFGYQDDDNYYRFELDGMKGHRKLWRKQGGLYTELSTSPQSYVRGQSLDLRIVYQNGVIVVFAGGQHIMAAADATFSSGEIALFCARNSSCAFDDVSVTTASSAPKLGLAIANSLNHTSSEYFVSTDGVLDVVAFSTSLNGVGGVEFVVDEGAANEIFQTDFASPYSTQFTALSAGDHVIDAYLLDSSGVRIVDAAATVNLTFVGTNGIHLHSFGDSITNGLEDDISSDDVSADTRNTGGGYAPILNDLLSADNSMPVTVINDGNSGEESFEGALRIEAIIQRTPEAQAFLVFYGANDSGGTMPTLSGLGLAVDDAGYAGSFKDNIQQIIDAALSAGKVIFLAKAPPYFANTVRNVIVDGYNQVIDELVFENEFSYVPPDLHGYFTANPSEYSIDGIHPDGVGYQSIANLWCQGLDGQLGLSCSP